MSDRPEIFLVVAVAGDWREGGVIGVDGTLPWHIPADLRHFKALTMHMPMVMGRKTFESLPGLLPGRRHIVLTRSHDWHEDGAEVVHTVEQAVQCANAPHIAVVGGAEVYRLFLPLAQRIEWTRVHAEPQGDTIFPPLDPADWREVASESHAADGRTPGFDFVTLLRNPSAA